MRVVAELEFGSSPRVRGAGTIAFADAGALRIIPARAGSSDALNGRAWRDEDHPRACGEQTVKSSGGVIVAGSSPRVRGAGIAVFVDDR